MQVIMLPYVCTCGCTYVRTSSLWFFPGFSSIASVLFLEYEMVHLDLGLGLDLGCPVLYCGSLLVFRSAYLIKLSFTYLNKESVKQ